MVADPCCPALVNLTVLEVCRRLNRMPQIAGMWSTQDGSARHSTNEFRMKNPWQEGH